MLRSRCRESARECWSHLAELASFRSYAVDGTDESGDEDRVTNSETPHEDRFEKWPGSLRDPSFSTGLRDSGAPLLSSPTHDKRNGTRDSDIYIYM